MTIFAITDISAQNIRIPFEKKNNGHITVKAIFNDSIEQQTVIDNGIFYPLFDSGFLVPQKLNINAVNNVYYHNKSNISGNYSGRFAYPDFNIMLENYKIPYKRQIVVTNLFGGRLKCVLPMEYLYLKGKLINIDFQNKYINLTDTIETYQYEPIVFENKNMFKINKGILVELHYQNKFTKVLSLAVDFGYPGFMILLKKRSDTLNLNYKKNSLGNQFYFEVDSTNIIYGKKTISFGNNKIYIADSLSGEVDGVVGLEFLQYFNITVDYLNNMLYLKNERNVIKRLELQVKQPVFETINGKIR